MIFMLEKQKSIYSYYIGRKNSVDWADFWEVSSEKDQCTMLIDFSLQVPLSASMSPVRLHASNPNLYADVEFQNPPSHVADALEFASDYTKLQEEFCLLAQKGII